MPNVEKGEKHLDLKEQREDAMLLCRPRCDLANVMTMIDFVSEG